MAIAVARALGDRIVAGVVTSASPPRELGHWQAFPASHPRPSIDSERGGRAALALADATLQDDGVLLVCLSGGASAMLAVPASGLTLMDKSDATGHLLRAGLDIGALNVVRRHLSAVKGGQLAARAGRSITLAISDVCTPVDDDPSVIGSGPTAADDTTFAQAVHIVERHGLSAALPPRVVAHLHRGAEGRVTGPVPSGDPRLAHALYRVIASRRDAMNGASESARALGYDVTIVEAPTIGEARVASAPLFDRLDRASRPACLVASGETTVEVRGTGRGGRNQELAVAALESLASRKPAALASVGTDGQDGPTDAAGALVDADMWDALGPSARERCRRALEDNDAYPLLDGLGALFKTGPTGTNVGDLQILLAGDGALRAGRRRADS